MVGLARKEVGMPNEPAMAATAPQPPVPVDEACEVVASFDSRDDLQAAIDELLSSGFNQHDLSLLASEATADSKLRRREATTAEAGDDPNAPRQVYVSTEDRGDFMGALMGVPMYIGGFLALGVIVASGGTLLAAIAAAAAASGAGLVIGGVLAKRYGDTHAKRIEGQLAQGGLVLWVRAADREHEQKAMTILEGHAGKEVHVVRAL